MGSIDETVLVSADGRLRGSRSATRARSSGLRCAGSCCPGGRTIGSRLVVQRNNVLRDIDAARSVQNGGVGVADIEDHRVAVVLGILLNDGHHALAKSLQHFL